MQIAFRLITGFVVGFDIAPAQGVYLELSLGIIQILFADNDVLENL